MAVTAFAYGNFLLKALNKEIKWSTSSPDTFKVMLCTSSYSPNQDTHIYQNQITNEVTGTGYTAGGATLTSPTCTYDSSNVVILDAADVTWSNSTITARYAVIYDSTPGTAATNPLIGWIDFGNDMSSSGGNFTITFDATGIIRITVA